MGCFFDLRIDTWADALLALSVMQAAACDVRERWQRMGRDTRAAALPLPNLPSLRQALMQATPSRGGRSDRGSTTGAQRKEQRVAV